MSKIFTVILFTTLGTLLSAQSCEIYVSSDTILIGNDVLVKYTMENMGGDFSPPPFEDFKIISGPNTSSSVSIINGDRTSKTTYSYYLRPLKEGIIEIPPAIVEDDGLVVLCEKKNLTILPNPENLIIIPEEEENSMGSFFEMRTFPFGQREPSPQPKQKKTKPKRKYKRI